MKERPILFSGPMVRAILSGRKTQTRRVIKPEPFVADMMNGTPVACWHENHMPCFEPLKCPYGKPGDRLWVREAWRVFGGREYEYQQCQSAVRYLADAEVTGPDYGLSDEWRPSIHMFRWASRITLEITSVRVERLQEISDDDAVAEGVTEDEYYMPHITGMLNNRVQETPVDGYRRLWKTINGKASWDKNPWVWVVSFKRA